MTHWRKYVSANNPDLHHWDIEGLSPVDVTIVKHGMKDVHGDDNEKVSLCFLWFHKAKKPLGINATNGLIIEALHGPDIESWIGKTITLRTAQITNGPKRGTDCIRVDIPSGFKLPSRCHKFKYTDTPGKAGQVRRSGPIADDEDVSAAPEDDDLERLM